MEKIVIIGCGGVGSRIAEFLVRDNLREKFMDMLYLVDHDTIEFKNLQRQFYFQQDINFKKTEALKARLKSIDPDLVIVTHNIQVNKDNIALFDSKMFCFCCTDDINGKRAISEHFENYIIASVDRDVVEITVNPGYLNVWSFGTGYSVYQDVVNNNMAAMIAFKLFKNYLNGMELKNVKLNIKELIERSIS